MLVGRASCGLRLVTSCNGDRTQSSPASYCKSSPGAPGRHSRGSPTVSQALETLQFMKEDHVITPDMNSYRQSHMEEGVTVDGFVEKS